jgi:hypothetical protein
MQSEATRPIPIRDDVRINIFNEIFILFSFKKYFMRQIKMIKFSKFRDK